MEDKSSYKYFAHRWVRSQTTRAYISPYKAFANPTPRKHKSSSAKPPRKYIFPYNKSIVHIPTPAPQAQAQQTTNPSIQDPRFSFTYILNTSTPVPNPVHHQNTTFQNLPQEIRRRIWNYARSRTIGITISSDHISSRSPSPVTFRINRESRDTTKIHYKVHPSFYILGTEYSTKICYPFFDPGVDSVVVVGELMGGSAAMGTIFGVFGVGAGAGADFWGRSAGFRNGYREMDLDFQDPLDVVQSLHIPAHAWNWGDIGRTLRKNMRFTNLREIVLQGGEMGLITKEDIGRCKGFIGACFERSVEEMAEEVNSNTKTSQTHSEVRVEYLASREIKVPKIKIFMPKILDYGWMFEEEKLGMESIEERKWVMNFIRKVKADR
ncbi:394607aa-394b-4b51-8c20-239a2937cbe6 [Sclerotinia trifoliorum]|uniref:394607aa-394b-4b51-8c20-239a2937cbe6 n=1 Tax=Sclerotinia trifoliorum TaxID=28548 RepID=A0A8H2ZR32_9HELO|nr:394607aa-394b-4b51-8c20-239a2937cbe6 [Sclerotinia trifoliorum]